MPRNEKQTFPFCLKIILLIPFFVWYTFKISSAFAHELNPVEAECCGWTGPGGLAANRYLQERERGVLFHSSSSQAGVGDALPGLSYTVLGLAVNQLALRWSNACSSLFPALSCNLIKGRPLWWSWACTPSRPGLPCWHLSVWLCWFVPKKSELGGKQQGCRMRMHWKYTTL